jgi:hypothetical protein
MTQQELAELIRGTPLHIEWDWRPGDYAILRGFTVEIVWIDGKLLYYLPVYKDSIGEQGDSVDDMYDVAENLTPDLLNPYMLSRVLEAIEAKGYAPVVYYLDNYIELFRSGIESDHCELSFENQLGISHTAVRALLHVHEIKEE